MATVRIYKVAELLNTSSQEVMALLKRDHGIEVKSASSTIEEVVAREFVSRMARQRGLNVPSNASFADTPAAAKGKRPGGKAPEPPKPSAPALPPPRLVKSAKPPVDPAAPLAAAPAAAEAVLVPPPAPPPEFIAPEPEPIVAAPVVEAAPEPPPAPPAPDVQEEPVIAAHHPAPAASEPSPAPPIAAAPPAPPPAPRPPVPAPTGRVVPPTIRLRVEDPRTGQAPPAPPPRPGGARRDVVPRVATTAPAQMPPPPVTRTITLAEGMTVADLATKLDVKAKDVLKKLMDRRLMMTINSTLDDDTAAMIAREFGADVKMQTFEEEMLQVEAEDIDPADLVTRAPVVTVMGHVDHGKTTLLDAIRSARVAEREAGGITQHIGAYSVTVNDRDVVFLDTPGHEAFTMMRARGARVTDVVILFVAADDGVMPQTREAIDHAKAASVPILVAINKIDKPNANPERVKKELADLGLTPEAWGGSTVMVEVSAKKKENLELLLEMILLVTELSELKANPKRNASGTVLEAKLDKGRGPVATILVQDGTLRVGDTFIAGTIVGKVRALIDDRGRQIKSAGPATPVEVLGLGGLPAPGDAFQALTDAAKARQIAHFRQSQAKEKALGGKGTRLTLESLQQQIAEGDMKELPIIIKADVQGSAEVLADTLTKLTDEKVKIRIIHSGVGAINESDVLLASASNAIIIGFNVRPDRNASDVADREKVDIRLHSVIYNVVDEMKKAMTGLLEPTFKETRMGAAAVREIFKVPKFGTIAGCMVTEGTIKRSGDTQARLLRDNVVVHEGKIGSLRRFKDDVSEVKAGFECGIGFEKYNDIKVGDVIEVFVVERVAATA